MTREELENAKDNIEAITARQINNIHESFKNLENIPIKSFNNKTREMKYNIIENIRKLNKTIQDQLVW